ncbi:RusA family crossover junction endodeoxyribonuclease [Persephonella atlantica]|uniref:RusA family crossover junction endodeoxyribonuclease n=1 Tax=Persephonella atlantica TaxID=2699429 RepID=A0ABS1GIN4_9AQUI|nr:RusA family crossover junction endodeoxyribonuclease [Persephonella atlantica]MBK3332607.1 RusA family crossover junction endodeoxyribonuclease [Persephonella atlantica]
MLKKVRKYYLSFVPPSKANRVKLNLRAYTKSGKRYIVPKDVSIKINRAIWELQNQHSGESISIPVYINVIFILPNRKRRDLDNIMKTLGDCLVYAGVLKDDNLIFKQTLEKRVIKGMEGVIIEIGLYNKKKINDKIIEELRSYKEGIDGI